MGEKRGEMVAVTHSSTIPLLISLMLLHTLVADQLLENVNVSRCAANKGGGVPILFNFEIHLRCPPLTATQGLFVCVCVWEDVFCMCASPAEPLRSL